VKGLSSALLGLFAPLLLGAASPMAPLPIVGIAHVAFQSSDLAASATFYTGTLGYELAFKVQEPAEAWYFKVNDGQFIKLVAVPGTTADDRLVEVAWQVTDISQTRAALLARGLEASPLTVRADGTRATTLRDPDGHLVAFVEYTPDSRQVETEGRYLGARRVSMRLWHTGVAVADEQRARAFYEQRLGFEEIWRGGPEGQPTAWINVRPPGGRGDYLEYMLTHGNATRERLGSMHHICLQVDAIGKAHEILCSHGLPDTERHQPRLGRINRWLVNLYDPDGTRSELMEATFANPSQPARNSTNSTAVTPTP
jgi:catechol 2,3-dioxygenase-like lactoylglutathione lyase family enzyme